MNYRHIVAILVAILALSAHCQNTIYGSVCDSDTEQEVPYAAIHIENTTKGTYCNEAGQFVLHTPKGMENAQVIISSLGYCSDTVKVKTLIRHKGKVYLKTTANLLKTVEITEYATARDLMKAVIERIPKNYRIEPAIGIWYCKNHQMVNNRDFVKSEGMIRSYLLPYNDNSTYYLHGSPGTDRWEEDVYRYCQSLDTIIVYDSTYWRNLLGVKKLDTVFDLEGYSKPSNHFETIALDFVKTAVWRSTQNFLFSKKSSFSMETLDQDGKRYYRVNVTSTFKHLGKDGTITRRFLINKDDLAIVEMEHIFPKQEYFALEDKLFRKYKKYYKSKMLYRKIHFRYFRYDGEYQLGHIHYEYEYRIDFGEETKKIGCKTPRITLRNVEDCILTEYSREGVEEYRRRYVDNDHPLTEENIKETERILRQPRSMMPW